MKNIRFYTIAVLFDKLPTPNVNRLYMDIRYSTFDIGRHVISCLREWSSPFSLVIIFNSRHWKFYIFGKKCIVFHLYLVHQNVLCVKRIVSKPPKDYSVPVPSPHFSHIHAKWHNRWLPRHRRWLHEASGARGLSISGPIIRLSPQIFCHTKFNLYVIFQQVNATATRFTQCHMIFTKFIELNKFSQSIFNYVGYTIRPTFKYFNFYILLSTDTNCFTK